MSISFRAAMHSSRLSAPLAAVLVCSVATSALAAEPPDPPENLEAVVVTAAPVSPLTFDTDPRLPRQPVPASDGADYLKTIPGFNSIRNGGSNGDPVLRGMFGSRLNVTTNEGSMPGACPARMDNPLSYVSPETYDRLVVVKGPQTVLWGPGASAGTVRFERDAERFDEPGARMSGSLLGASHGRNDQVLEAAAGAPLGYARLTANRSDSDDYKDGDGERVPSRWSKWNADVAFGWTPDVDTLLEVSAGTGDGEARYAGRGMDGAQFKRNSYALRLQKKNIGGALDALQASVFHNDADHVMDNYSLREPNPTGSMPMPMASNVDRRTAGGRFAATWKWDVAEVTAGADMQDSRHRQRNAMGRDAYRAQPWSTDARFGNIGVFSEATWARTERNRVVAGARVDRAEANDQRRTAGMMGMPNPTAGVTRKETLPGGFLRFEQDAASAPLTWYAGIGHTERMPDYWELFSADMGPADASNAFEGIDPEKTTQLDMGVQFRSGKMEAWVSAYAGRVDDFILFTYGEGGMMGPMSSVANVDARIHGGEAGVEYRPAQHWKLGATLAYAWGENRAQGTALPQMPPLETRMSLSYDNTRWSFGALLRAVAGQDRVAPGQGNVVGRDLGRGAGFAVFALNGGYRFSDKMQMTAGVDNVFDRNYSEHLNLAGSADFGYPAEPVRIDEPGRAAWLKLNFAY
jgi:iron complex outermembrane receptor protein